MSKEEWIHYFPYSEPRKEQVNSIDKIIDAYKSGKKYAIVECGTGVGKSAIGLTAAKYIINDKTYDSEKENGAYFLTTQKVLQDQYEKDFYNIGMRSLYSATNYQCKKSKGNTCSEIAQDLKANPDNQRLAGCKFDCVYKQKKKEFIEDQLGITNFSYFLTEKNYSGKIPNKRILVIDEAHNLESELTRFIEISVSQFFAEKVLKISFPNNLDTKFKSHKWIKEVYIHEVEKKLQFMESQIKKIGISLDKLKEFKSLSNQLNTIKSHKEKIKMFLSLYDKENWVFTEEKTDKGYTKLVFKPIDVSSYANQYILDFADFVIFMSATIVSHKGFAKTIGLEEDNYISIREKSPFDPKNRAIIYSPAGSMGSKNIDTTLPKMIESIKCIIDAYPDKKGIIHTHNTKIATEIKNRIKSDRLLVAVGSNREEILKKHIKSKKPTILVSPSMTEGVDLKGDLSSFQIICKVPFPYLGDKVIKKKMHKWDWWYNTQTVRTIVQSVGRSIRCETDVATTYILDSDFMRIKNRCEDYFPPGFFDEFHYA